MEPNPLISQEINDFDYNDPSSNPNYKKEIEILYNEIFSSLSKSKFANENKITENDLISDLQSRVPKGKTLNVTLFKQLFQDLDKENNKIDLSDFTKKYIQSHEELKLSLETFKKMYEKDKELLNDLEEKKNSNKNEMLNDKNISNNSEVNIEIGKVEIINNNFINLNDNYYFLLSVDNAEKKTTIQKGNSLEFIEKISLPIQNKNEIIQIKLFNVNNNNLNDEICKIEIPIFELEENEEVNPPLELIDNNSISIGIFNPKILLITSFYRMYEKQIENIEKNIQNYKNKIQELNEIVDDLSSPFLKNFNDSQQRNLNFNAINNLGNNFVENVEGILKSTFKKKKLNWIDILKYLNYLTILCVFFTMFAKPDFISIFFEICIVVVINLEMTNYLIDYFSFFFIGILLAIFYDIIDFNYLRKIRFNYMENVEDFVSFFGFFAFVVKILICVVLWIIKIKYRKKINI